MTWLVKGSSAGKSETHYSPKASEAYREVAERNIVFYIARLGKEDDKSCNKAALWTNDERISPRVFIGENCKDVGRDGSNSIWRNCQKLSISSFVAHTLENARHCKLHGVIRNGVVPIGENKTPDFVVKQNILEKSPIEVTAVVFVISRSIDSAGDLAKLKISDLIGLQPFGRESGRVAKKESTHNTDDDGGYAFDNEYPAPTLKASQPVHLDDGKGEKAREAPASGSRCVENRDSDLSFVREVPVRDNENGSR